MKINFIVNYNSNYISKDKLKRFSKEKRKTLKFNQLLSAVIYIYIRRNFI